MRKVIIALFLFSGVAFAAHVTVNVTPDKAKQHDLAVSVKVVEQTIKEGDKPVRVTGHSYRLTMKSQKLDLKNGSAFLHVIDGKGSSLGAPLQVSRKEGYMSFRVSFSPDYLDKVYVIIHEGKQGSSFSYKLKIKDWIKTSEPADKR